MLIFPVGTPWGQVWFYLPSPPSKWTQVFSKRSHKTQQHFEAARAASLCEINARNVPAAAPSIVAVLLACSNRGSCVGAVVSPGPTPRTLAGFSVIPISRGSFHTPSVPRTGCVVVQAWLSGPRAPFPLSLLQPGAAHGDPHRGAGVQVRPVPKGLQLEIQPDSSPDVSRQREAV